MSLWWLSASAAKLDAARTCRDCGCKDADIDLGLCFDCFSKQQPPSRGDEIEAHLSAQYEDYIQSLKEDTHE